MPSSENSVAVLPFVNMSSDPENEYFSDGVTEEIINALTKIDGLRVTARTSSFAFKGKNIDVRQIGRELGVTTVLEGSVRKAGNQVRITAQLINVKDGCHYWAENYDHQLEDIFAIQDEISLKIAEKLREHLGHFDIQDRLVKHPTENIDAYQIYLKGRFHGNKWTPTDFEIAIKLYTQAIDMEPSFALPYAGMADVFSAMGALGLMDNKAAFEKARLFANKALNLDAYLAESHIALANIYFWSDWEFSKAHSALHQALQYAPGNSEAKGFLGLYKAFAGGIQEGQELLADALRADPYSLQLHYGMCAIYQLKEEYQLAMKEASIILELNPQFMPAKLVKGYSAYQLGQYETCIEIFEDATRAIEGPNEGTGWLACCYQKMNQMDQAQALYDEVLVAKSKNKITPCTHYTLAMYQMNQGDYQEAIRMLEEGIIAGIGDFVFMDLDPSFKVLRSEPGFQSLVAQIKKRRPDINPGASNSTRYATSKLSPSDANQINSKLLIFMNQEKPYLDNQLSLRLLAERLNVNTNYLSQVINEQHGVNFFEFINKYRVDALKEKLRNPKNQQFTLLSLAFECGFNSKTTFNTAFKKITGVTPSRYVKGLASSN